MVTFHVASQYIHFFPTLENGIRRSGDLPVPFDVAVLEVEPGASRTCCISDPQRDGPTSPTSWLCLSLYPTPAISRDSSLEQPRQLGP